MLVPVGTNSFIFLIYDSYLKKSTDKLDDHEKILYEQLFENDESLLDKSEKEKKEIFMSTTDNNVKDSDRSDIHEYNDSLLPDYKQASENFQFSNKFMNKKKNRKTSSSHDIKETKENNKEIESDQDLK